MPCLSIQNRSFALIITLDESCCKHTCFKFNDYGERAGTLELGKTAREIAWDSLL